MEIEAKSRILRTGGAAVIAAGLAFGVGAYSLHRFSPLLRLAEPDRIGYWGTKQPVGNNNKNESGHNIPYLAIVEALAGIALYLRGKTKNPED